MQKNLPSLILPNNIKNQNNLGIAMFEIALKYTFKKSLLQSLLTEGLVVVYIVSEQSIKLCILHVGKPWVRN